MGDPPPLVPPRPPDPSLCKAVRLNQERDSRRRPPVSLPLPGERPDYGPLCRFWGSGRGRSGRRSFGQSRPVEFRPSGATDGRIPPAEERTGRAPGLSRQPGCCRGAPLSGFPVSRRRGELRVVRSGSITQQRGCSGCRGRVSRPRGVKPGQALIGAPTIPARDGANDRGEGGRHVRYCPAAHPLPKAGWALSDLGGSLVLKPRRDRRASRDRRALLSFAVA